MAGNDNKAVVIDNGSYRMRAGLAGEDTPSSTFPCMIGRPKDGGAGEFIGRNAQAKLDALNCNCPIENGVVTNWDDMEKIWNYTFAEELKVKSSALPVMLTERPCRPKENKEKMTEIMFEKFNVPSLFSGIQAVLALYATGRYSGMVVNSGEEVTYAVPVFAGYAVPDGIVKMDCGGKHVTQRLRTLLNESGHNFHTASEADIVRQIKEGIGYVATDFEAECNKNITQNFQLPDGKEIKVGKEAFECAEIMFNPGKYDLPGSGLANLILDSSSKCEIDVRKELLTNTILAGGNTMIKHLPDRLKQELKAKATTTVKVVASHERESQVWIGASILASLDTFKDITVKSEEYQEQGPQAIHKKY